MNADRGDLLRRIAEFADGRASAEEADELSAILVADESARLLYLQWMDLQIELENVAVAKPKGRTLLSIRWLAAAAAVVLLGLWTWRSGTTRVEASRRDELTGAARPVAPLPLRSVDTCTVWWA